MVNRHNKYGFNETAGYRLELNFMSDWDLDENAGMFHGILSSRGGKLELNGEDIFNHTSTNGREMFDTLIKIVV